MTLKDKDSTHLIMVVERLCYHFFYIPHHRYFLMCFQRIFYFSSGPSLSKYNKWVNVNIRRMWLPYRFARRLMTGEDNYKVHEITDFTVMWVNRHYFTLLRMSTVSIMLRNWIALAINIIHTLYQKLIDVDIPVSFSDSISCHLIKKNKLDYMYLTIHVSHNKLICNKLCSRFRLTWNALQKSKANRPQMVAGL